MHATRGDFDHLALPLDFGGGVETFAADLHAGIQAGIHFEFVFQNEIAVDLVGAEETVRRVEHAGAHDGVAVNGVGGLAAALGPAGQILAVEQFGPAGLSEGGAHEATGCEQGEKRGFFHDVQVGFNDLMSMSFPAHYGNWFSTGRTRWSHPDSALGARTIPRPQRVAGTVRVRMVPPPPGWRSGCERGTARAPIWRVGRAWMCPTRCVAMCRGNSNLTLILALAAKSTDSLRVQDRSSQGWCVRRSPGHSGSPCVRRLQRPGTGALRSCSPCCSLLSKRRSAGMPGTWPSGYVVRWGVILTA